MSSGMDRVDGGSGGFGRGRQFLRLGMRLDREVLSSKQSYQSLPPKYSFKRASPVSYERIFCSLRPALIRTFPTLARDGPMDR